MSSLDLSGTAAFFPTSVWKAGAWTQASQRRQESGGRGLRWPEGQAGDQLCYPLPPPPGRTTVTFRPRPCQEHCVGLLSAPNPRRGQTAPCLFSTGALPGSSCLFTHFHRTRRLVLWHPQDTEFLSGKSRAEEGPSLEPTSCSGRLCSHGHQGTGAWVLPGDGAPGEAAAAERCPPPRGTMALREADKSTTRGRTQGGPCGCWGAGRGGWPRGQEGGTKKWESGLPT